MTAKLATIAPVEDYGIDGIVIDCNHLSHLLDVTIEVLMGMEYGTGPTRNHELDRVAALVWIARDMAQNAVKQAEADRKVRGMMGAGS